MTDRTRIHRRLVDNGALFARIDPAIKDDVRYGNFSNLRRKSGGRIDDTRWRHLRNNYVNPSKAEIMAISDLLGIDYDELTDLCPRITPDKDEEDASEGANAA